MIEQTTRNQVSVTKQVELGMAIPAPEEQDEIVRRVHDLLERADQVEKRLADVQASPDHSPSALLAKAFYGELVPTEAALAEREGREYESASKLVQRIERSEPQLAQLAVDARSASERIRAAIFTTSVRMAAFVRGRPGRSRAQRRAHRRRNQWRCQSTTVSGSTDDQGCSPIPPRVGEQHPEQPISVAELRTPHGTLEYGVVPLMFATGSAGMMYTCVSDLAACCADSRRYEPLLTRFSLTS